MTDNQDQPVETGATAWQDPPAGPLLVDDVLLLLFQPSSGTIAGENTLFYVLGGAVLAELALCGLTRVDESGRRVAAIGAEPSNDVLGSGWRYIATKPRNAQSVIAAIGPDLRAEVLDRLVDAGHLLRRRRKLMGFIPTESLTLGSGRRAELLARVRTTLVDGADPDTRTGATIALLSASANLHRFDPDIPWTSSVITRAKDLENGSWSATAAGMAVTRTTVAVITGAVLPSTAANG